MTKTYHEFVEDLNYSEIFHKSMGLMLINEGFGVDYTEKCEIAFIKNIQPPSNNSEVLKLYLIKEKLNNDVNEYEKLFGLEYLKFAKFLMDNIHTLYYSLEKRLISMYREYNQKELRKQAADRSDKREQVFAILNNPLSLNDLI